MTKINIKFPAYSTSEEKKMIIALIGNIVAFDDKCYVDENPVVIAPLENDTYQLDMNRTKKLSFINDFELNIIDKYSTITEEQKILIERTFIDIYGEEKVSIEVFNW